MWQMQMAALRLPWLHRRRCHLHTTAGTAACSRAGCHPFAGCPPPLLSPHGWPRRVGSATKFGRASQVGVGRRWIFPLKLSPSPRSHLFPLPSPPTSFPPLGGPAQSDSEGHGVVAQRPLSAGETLVDWSVFFITRPPDYALAHLPQFHALEFGHESYFLLREPMLGHCSLTYFVNEARHGGADGPPPNVAYKVVRPKDGGVALALLVLAPIDEGVELLASYDQKLAHAFR